MTFSCVTVFGGSGFLGRRIVERLADGGAVVRVAVRHPERAALFGKAGTTGQIVPTYAGVWDERSVAPAVKSADAVINTVGHYVEHGKDTFGAIHGQGAMNVARASAMAGVQRLVHISGLGADPASDSPYVRARAAGEHLVREAFPGATILRPSVVFGPEDAFFYRLAALGRLMPVLPLFGRGEVKLQPVHVGDVAEAAAKALAMPMTRGRTYELGGPRVYPYKALLRLVIAATGRKRLLIPVPYVVWDILAFLLSPLPRAPISRDQVTLMKRDNVVAADALSLADPRHCAHAGGGDPAGLPTLTPARSACARRGARGASRWALFPISQTSPEQRLLRRARPGSPRSCRHAGGVDRRGRSACARR